MESKALPARITFISHAPTLAVRNASFPRNEALLESEIGKISAIGWTAPRVQQLWCGPEMRTRQTAEALGLKASVVTELADIDYGHWGGKTIDEIQLSDPNGLADWLTDPNTAPHGGGSLVQLIARVDKWMMHQTNAGHTLAVTHPAVIRAAILCALQSPPESFWRVEIAPFSITDLRFNGRFWIVRSAGFPL